MRGKLCFLNARWFIPRLDQRLKRSPVLDVKLVMQMTTLRVFFGNMAILLVWWNRACKSERTAGSFNTDFPGKKKLKKRESTIPASLRWGVQAPLQVSTQAVRGGAHRRALRKLFLQFSALSACHARSFGVWRMCSEIALPGDPTIRHGWGRGEWTQSRKI